MPVFWWSDCRSSPQMMGSRAGVLFFKEKDYQRGDVCIALVLLIQQQVFEGITWIFFGWIGKFSYFLVWVISRLILYNVTNLCSDTTADSLSNRGHSSQASSEWPSPIWAASPSNRLRCACRVYWEHVNGMGLLLLVRQGSPSLAVFIGRFREVTWLQGRGGSIVVRNDSFFAPSSVDRPRPKRWVSA